MLPDGTMEGTKDESSSFCKWTKRDAGKQTSTLIIVFILWLCQLRGHWGFPRFWCQCTFKKKRLPDGIFIKPNALVAQECVKTHVFSPPFFFLHEKLQSYRTLVKENPIYLISQGQIIPLIDFPHRFHIWSCQLFKCKPWGELHGCTWTRWKLLDMLAPTQEFLLLFPHIQNRKCVRAHLSKRSLTKENARSHHPRWLSSATNCSKRDRCCLVFSPMWRNSVFLFYKSLWDNLWSSSY